MKVGILALQGDVREHIGILKKLDAEPVMVKMPNDLTDIDALIIPGGESTVIGMLMKKCRLDRAIKEKHGQGMPIYGTCAGAILLAKVVVDSKQYKLGLMDIIIERNAYGRQIDSFEAELNIKDVGYFNGVFIRAPVIKGMYDGAEVLAEYKKSPVMVKQNNILVTTFHPELSNDKRVHQYFLNMAKEFKEIKDIHRHIEAMNGPG
jgi:pyridoxal 5'-phosphate synthase pdxT subunit